VVIGLCVVGTACLVVDSIFNRETKTRSVKSYHNKSSSAMVHTKEPSSLSEYVDLDADFINDTDSVI
jgi:hypothetical protein